MRTEPSLLLPIFRSDGQRRLLARLYLAPGRAVPLAELARELGIDRGGVKREADRLERAGLIYSERVGNQRFLRPNTDSPYYAHLHALLLKAFGPASLVGPAFRDVRGVEDAYLFGSWAARYAGEPGPDPADIDVLLIGSPDRSAAYRVARQLEDVFGREVNPVIVSRERWEEASEGFIREIKSAPLVQLDLDRRDGGDAR